MYIFCYDISIEYLVTINYTLKIKEKQKYNRIIILCVKTSILWHCIFRVHINYTFINFRWCPNLVFTINSKAQMSFIVVWVVKMWKKKSKTGPNISSIGKLWTRTLTCDNRWSYYPPFLWELYVSSQTLYYSQQRIFSKSEDL